MAKKKEYIERVEVAATAVLGDEQVTNLLTERCGIARVDVEAIQTRIEPVRVGARHMSDSVQGLKQSTNDLKAKVTGIKRDLTSLRTTLNNHLKRKDPLFTKLGLNEARPGAQEPLLAYAEHAFTQGQNLSAAEGAVLTKHKWDHPRFTAALTQVLAARALNVQQEGCKGDAVATTNEYYTAIDALDEVFRPFAKDARSNLADVPGVLEKMELKDGIPGKPRRPAAWAARKKTPSARKAAEAKTTTSKTE